MATCHAGQRDDQGQLRPNGRVSTRLYVPAAAERVAGEPVSAGLALGVKGPLRQHVGWAAPSITFDLSGGSKLSLMATPGKGAMLVLQAAGW